MAKHYQADLSSFVLARGPVTNVMLRIGAEWINIGLRNGTVDANGTVLVELSPVYARQLGRELQNLADKDQVGKELIHGKSFASTDS